MGALVVIGNFDGVHRGHQALLARAADEARTRALDGALLTFHPHPARVLGREPPPLLTRQARKRALVARAAPSLRFVEKGFDLAFAGTSAPDFAAWLRRDLGAESVLVGADFRFGKGRAGDLEALTTLGTALGFEAHAHELLGDEGGPWSSTRARAALAAGDLDEVERILGRPHMFEGVVEHGKQLGRTLGFPTANLGGIEEALPPLGVYAVLVDQVVDGEARALGLGAMSVGKNPTTDHDETVKAEVFVFDFAGDLYGATLRVHLVHRLRGEERFDGLDALVTQMKRDVDGSRAALAGRAAHADGAYG